ncbi:hypothetical protein AVEN_100189-1 [Araneus ventricosus]|uniref:Uncharacterized protein n=1 Tax=Araneus ventricosus TaxID=182803 RepID=A0A4Y2NH66_ARAVE|nr:hypothetical protein AVEN_100189-1 [Araneus ventricosus]
MDGNYTNLENKWPKVRYSFLIDQEIKVDDPDGDECVEEKRPRKDERRQALDILKRDVHHCSTNFNKQYEYERYINELLWDNCRQATVNEFINCYF